MKSARSGLMSNFYIRIRDVGGIKPEYAERYRSVFESYSDDGNYLYCGGWSWVSDKFTISQCYIRLKILRTL